MFTEGEAVVSTSDPEFLFILEIKKMLMNDDDIASSLKDAGCSSAIVGKFLEQKGRQCDFEKKRLLNSQRKVLLDKIHKHQKHLDCLDYLIYQLDKREKA